jgi:hypothetical protein
MNHAWNISQTPRQRDTAVITAQSIGAKTVLGLAAFTAGMALP